LRVVNPQTLAIVALGLALPESADAAAGLNLFPRFELLALNIFVFTLLIYPVNKLLLQPLVRVLEQREARTLGALERAQATLVDATEVRGEFEGRLREVRTRAAARRGEVLAAGEAEVQQALEGARAEAGEALDRVRRGVAAELQAARQTLRADSSELAREAASKILGRAL
jgi:F-type H+-transporting ATPase subunit b